MSEETLDRLADNLEALADVIMEDGGAAVRIEAKCSMERAARQLRATAAALETADRERYEAQSELARLKIKAVAEPVAVCRVMEMQLSSGQTDYYVSIERSGKQITPHMYTIRGRAEYDVARWNWLLNGADEPDILAFDTDPPPTSAP